MPMLYRTEIHDEGCKQCGVGRTWDIVGPDGIALSITYGDKEQADDICEMLTDAYEMGRDGRD